MNSFEEKFFVKYVGEGHELLGIIHKHLSVIFLRLFFWLSLAILPSFIFYYSQSIKEFIPFYILEIYLIIIYIKIIYDTFDWYNDVWMITDGGIIDLKWSLLKKKVDSVDFNNIEGLGVEQNGIMDTILKKGDLVIHKIGDDQFILEDVFKPFKQIDLIEEISSYQEDDDDGSSVTEERFNMLINTLGGLMEGYVNKNQNNIEEEHINKGKIEKVKNKKGTIDLR